MNLRKVFRVRPLEICRSDFRVNSQQAEWFDLINDDKWKATKFQCNQPCFNARPFWKVFQMRMKFWILLNSRAIAINSKSCRGNITNIEVATNKDARFNIRSRVYVLACGGIEIPRLILYSNRINNIIGLKSNVVGKYLSTHPKAGVGRLHLKKVG